MTRISRTQSIEKRRIHSSFVHRNKTVIDRASSVEAVTPVNPVFNNINYSSANHLMYSDTLYDNLIELKNEYLNFYHHERNLQQSILEIDEENLISIEKMKNLIDKYNMAINALSSFDLHLRTNFTEEIKNIIQEYEFDLNKIGISIVRGKELDIDQMAFKNSLIQVQDDGLKLFKPIKGMILKLYRGFRNIKGPYKEGYDDKYPHIVEGDNSGMVLDERS